MWALLQVSPNAMLRRETKPLLQVIFPDSEVCDDHESDYDQDGNNNGHVSA